VQKRGRQVTESVGQLPYKSIEEKESEAQSLIITLSKH
jgi:hypothetical protein